jgi:hypothetical protein
MKHNRHWIRIQMKSLYDETKHMVQLNYVALTLHNTDTSDGRHVWYSTYIQRTPTHVITLYYFHFLKLFLPVPMSCLVSVSVLHSM